MNRLLILMGKFALFIAGMVILTFIGLCVTGAYFASWPITRISPRHQRITSVMGLAVAAMTVARAYGLDKITAPSRNDATEAPEATEEDPDVSYPYTDDHALILGPDCFIALDGSSLTWRGQDFLPTNLTNAAKLTEGGD